MFKYSNVAIPVSEISKSISLEQGEGVGQKMTKCDIGWRGLSPESGVSFLKNILFQKLDFDRLKGGLDNTILLTF